MNSKQAIQLFLIKASLLLSVTVAGEVNEVNQNGGTTRSAGTAPWQYPAGKERLQIVKPERTTIVELSNTDINRIQCESGDINDVYFSEEKGISVTTDKDNAYIKYLIMEKNSAAGHPENEYVSARTEFYVTCDGEVYTLLAYPVDTAAKGILLTRGEGDRIARNLSIYEDMALEERAILLTHKVIKDTLDDSYTVKPSGEFFTMTLDDGRNLHIRKLRDIIVEGTGLALHEYSLSSSQEIMLDEKQLMHTSFGSNILALTLMPEDHVISVEKPGRFYVVTVGDEEF